jgi:splicing factor 3B subunit 3
MATTSSMFMYSLTVHRPDPSQGKIITALSHDVFGIIRAIAAFRLAGSNKGESLILVLLSFT